MLRIRSDGSGIQPEMKKPSSGIRRRLRGWTGDGSALRELEALAGAGLAGLLAGGPELGVHLLERAGDPVRDRAGLPRDAAARDVRGHVDLLAKVDRQEGGVRLLGEIVVREVPVELAPVDDELAAAVGDPHAGGRGLAAAGPGENVGWGAHGRVQGVIFTGLLASCVCFVPANTRSLVSIFAARRFLGSIPLTACMITNSGRFSRIWRRLR